MKTEIEELTIEGKTYVPKESVSSKPALSTDGLEYCVIRTYSAGVFCGYVKERDGKEATVLESRRIWYWEGAATLSEIAMKGTSKPENCKFPAAVDKQYLTEVIEVIPMTEEAKKTIDAVKVWTKHE